MHRDQHLQTIREKITQLGNAIMYSMSNSELSLPNTIITALQVDEEGQLWFTCQPFSPEFFCTEKTFPVRLHFYRKGLPFHLEVSGKAVLVSEPAGTNDPGSAMLVFKLKMNTVEYTEIADKHNRNRIGQALENGYNWMRRHLAYQPSKHSLPRWQSSNN
jgi:hypothetical protein